MIMKLLRGHFSTALVFLAIGFLVVIIGFYVWGIGYLVTTVATSNASQKPSSGELQFDIAAASKLDYRGIAPAVIATGTVSGQ